MSTVTESKIAYDFINKLEEDDIPICKELSFMERNPHIGLDKVDIFLDKVLNIPEKEKPFLRRILLMSTSQMRDAVAKAYDGLKWKRKVANMPDGQITAIYHNLLRAGKIK